MNSKVIIQVEPTKNVKTSYSIVVDKTTIKEVTNDLEWGHKYNSVIDDIAEIHNGLYDWKVVSVKDTTEQIKLTPIFVTEVRKSQKPKKSEERIIADFLIKHLSLDIPDIGKLYDVFQNKELALELYKANNKYFLEQNGLIEEIWDWWIKEKANKCYFKPSPYEIKKQYKEAHAVTDEERKEAQKIKQPKVYKYNNDLSGQLIKVVDYNTKELLGTVDYKHFERYIRHIGHVKTKNVKVFDASEYENVRCELHDAIFNALGGNRIDDRDRLGGAIDSIVNHCNKCLCGGTLNIIGNCRKCNTPFKPEFAIENLKSLIIKE